MISATEARELYDASGKDVENWINCKVRTQVESSAHNSKGTLLRNPFHFLNG